MNKYAVAMMWRKELPLNQVEINVHLCLVEAVDRDHAIGKSTTLLRDDDPQKMVTSYAALQIPNDELTP